MHRTRSPAQSASAFQWEDPFLLEDQLTDEERAIRDTARAYAQDKLTAARDRGLPGRRRPTGPSSMRWVRARRRSA